MKSRAAITDVLVLLLLYCGSLVVVNPIGNFPLIDDWAFGLAAKHFLETGDFRCEWSSMPLISHVLWGSLFCLPAGFSFTALRASSLVASFLGVLGCYSLVRHVGRPRWCAMVAAVLLAFNPIYYALANTFMTDSVFTAAIALAALFFARNLRTGSDLDLLLATAIAVVATLSRQLAIAVPIAFAPCRAGVARKAPGEMCFAQRRARPLASQH